MLIMPGQTKVWTQGQAEAFDSRMLFIWVPVQIVGYILLAGAFYFLSLRKEQINRFIDKLR